jgi:hypothetical protein
MQRRLKLIRAFLQQAPIDSFHFVRWVISFYVETISYPILSKEQAFVMPIQEQVLTRKTARRPSLFVLRHGIGVASFRRRATAGPVPVCSAYHVER